MGHVPKGLLQLEGSRLIRRHIDAFHRAGAHEITPLVDAHLNRPAGCKFTQPFVEALPCNPLMFIDAVRQELLAASGESGGRQWQQAHPTQVDRWGTPNAHDRIDLESPEDFRAFTLRTGSELFWPPAAWVD
jgi:CTP:molybdopterin cytidylyltransferase MocA